MIVAFGDSEGGFSLYVQDGRLVHELNAAGIEGPLMVATTPLPTGRVKVAFEFVPDGPPPAQAFLKYPPRPGTGRLYVNDQVEGEWHYEKFGGFGHPISTETFDIGRDLSSPVSRDYAAPFVFQGRMDNVRIVLP